MIKEKILKNMSELDIRLAIVKRASQLFVRKAVTGSTRNVLTAKYNIRMQLTFSEWFVALSKFTVDNGTLVAAQRASISIAEAPISDDEKKELMNETLDALMMPVQDFSTESENRAQITKEIRNFNFLGFNLGAVTGLQSLGFSTESPALDKSEVFKAVGDVLIFELSDQELIEYLDQRAILVGTGLSKRVVEDTRRLIRDNIFLGNASVQETAEIIAVAEGIPEWRALKVARTETQVAFNTAMNEVFARSGVRKKEWLTVGDHRVRPQHTTNELQGKIDFEFPFSSGQQHPGDGAGSINCRCSMFADLSDPSILLEPWDGGSTASFKRTPSPSPLGLEAVFITAPTLADPLLPRISETQTTSETRKLDD